MAKTDLDEVLRQLAVLNSGKLSDGARKKAMKKLDSSITGLEKSSNASEVAAIKGFRNQLNSFTCYCRVEEEQHVSS